MLLPPFVQLRFRIAQWIGVDPQTVLSGWLAKGTTRLAAHWDIVGTIAAAGVLGWYGYSEAATVKAILFPIALLAVALIAVGFFELGKSQENWR